MRNIHSLFILTTGRHVRITTIEYLQSGRILKNITRKLHLPSNLHYYTNVRNTIGLF